MKEFISICKAISDKTRVRILMALSGGELCVCQITGLLGLAPSTVSKHLSLLYNAGLVHTRKDSRWVYYRLADKKGSSKEAFSALKWIKESLDGNADIIADKKGLTKVLKKFPAEKVC